MSNPIHPDQCANCGGFEELSLKQWKSEHPRSQRKACLGKMRCRFYPSAFICRVCKFVNSDAKYHHANEECSVHYVLNS